MKILGISYNHSLHPFLWRLHKEGHDVATFVWKRRYRKLWDGKLRLVAEGPPVPQLRELLAALDPDAHVLSDYRVAGEYLRALKQPVWGQGLREAIGSDLAVGGWFDGEAWRLPHALLWDHGVWPGGMGPRLPGGLVLVRTRELPGVLAALLDARTDELKSAGFRGLAHLELAIVAPPGEPARLEPGGLYAGWPFLHTHAFLAELEDFGGLLAGAVPERWGPRFTVVLPVSVPPWPYPSPSTAEPPPPVEVRTAAPDTLARLYLHDVHLRDGKVWSAGTDGLVGVARGSAHELELARARALEVATGLQLPQVQYRPDVGRGVAGAMAMLEQRLGLVL